MEDEKREERKRGLWGDEYYGVCDGEIGYKRWKDNMKGRQRMMLSSGDMVQMTEDKEKVQWSRNAKPLVFSPSGFSLLFSNLISFLLIFLLSHRMLNYNIMLQLDLLKNEMEGKFTVPTVDDLPTLSLQNLNYITAVAVVKRNPVKLIDNTFEEEEEVSNAANRHTTLLYHRTTTFCSNLSNGKP